MGFMRCHFRLGNDHYSSMVTVIATQIEETMAGVKIAPQERQSGEALQRALEARGATISLEEARQLAKALLSLIEQGLIVPAEPRVRPAEERRE
jgi:hypothetical protein